MADIEPSVPGRAAPFSTGTAATSASSTPSTSTDDAMTRSEEELRVGANQRERGRVRLRKYITTE